MERIRKSSIVRMLLFASACVIAGSLSISPSLARPDFGVRGGAYTDAEEPFLGAEALFGLGGTKHWFGNPNIEHAFIENGDLTAFSLDFHYDFPTGQPYTIWAGAGPTLIVNDRNVAGNDDQTDAGLNLVFGVGSTKGEVRPYGQMKVVVVADDTQAVLGAGIRF
jgi:hypothetical protein